MNSLNPELTELTGARGFAARPFRRASARWLMALLPVAVCAAVARTFPAWVYMWLLAAASFAGAKYIALAACPLARRAPLPALLAWAFLWPGLNPLQFLTQAPRKVSRVEWLAAAAKTALGAAILWGALRFMSAAPTLVAGWTAMIGIAFLLHFGAFHLLSSFWRSLGFGAVPLMADPIAATSLADFWGRRWNKAFSDLMAHIFHPMARRFGPAFATIAVFLISGALHEVVISLPAGGGFGGPTFYFAVQAAGLLFERSALGRRCGLGRGVAGWLFTFAVAALPAYWLFHPVFIHRVILPMLHAISAIESI